VNFKFHFLFRWIVVYFFFKVLSFVLIQSDFTYLSGTLFLSIMGIPKVYCFSYSLPAVYFGIITIQVLNSILVHSFLYFSIVGLNKLPWYLLIIFCLCLFHFFIYTNFGYLKTIPGLYNLFFHIWDLVKLLIVSNGILPFLIFIYKNETTNSKI